MQPAAREVKQQAMARSDGLRKSTAILTAGALLSRFWGVALRSLMARVMGAEGIGLFQVVSAYFMGFVIPITDALAPATSRLVAKYSDGRRSPASDRVVVVAACMGVAAATASLLLARVVRPASPEARDALAPGPVGLMILSASVWAVLEGFFLGSENAAALIVAEQAAEACRFGLIALVLAHMALASAPQQVRWVIALTAFCETVGLAVMGLRYSMTEYSWKTASTRTAGKDSAAAIARELLETAVPVSLTRLAGSALRMAEVSLAPRALCAAGLSLSGAMAAYGQVTGMAGPVVFIPGVAVTSLAVSLVPDVARRGNTPAARRRVWAAAGAALAFGILVALAVRRLAAPISAMLYGRACDPAVVRSMALLAPALYLDQVTSSALRGLGRANIALVSDVAGWLVRLTFVVTLAGEPEWGIYGIAAAVIGSSTISALINVAAIAAPR